MSDQFTLSQPGEADYAHHINTGTPGISMDNRPAYCVPCQRYIAEPGEGNVASFFVLSHLSVYPISQFYIQ